MYGLTLVIHSWLRWFVLLAGFVAVGRAVLGASGRRPWTRGDNGSAAAFVHLLNAQVVVGLILYFLLSPMTRGAMRNVAAAMGDDAMRFWAVEHAFGMLIGTALASIGKARIRKTTDPVRRHRVALIFFGLALLIILASIPWPGAVYGRPLVRY